MWHMHSGAMFWLAPRNLDNTAFTQTQPTGLTKEFGITVGVNGRRFYMDWDACAAGNLLPIGSDLATNVGFRHGATQWGGRWIHLQMPEKAWFVFDADGLAAGALPEGLTSDPVAEGWALSADTLADLAAAIEVPAEELEKTVTTWNGYCDGGADLAFYRPENTLNKVAKAPFYAMLCTPTLLNTDGGRCATPRRASSTLMVIPFRICTRQASSVPSGVPCTRAPATSPSAAFSAELPPATRCRESPRKEQYVRSIRSVARAA